MEFSPWLLMLPLGILALVAASIKLVRSASVTAASAAIGLLLFVACFLLNSKPVYLAIDPLVGGGNITYLLVQLTFLYAMFCMKVAFLPGSRLSGRSAWAHLDTWVAFAFATAITTLFLASDTPVTAYRVDPYRAHWSVAAYTQLVNIYSAGCGFLIIQQASHLVAAPTQTRLRRAGTLALIAGFAIGVITAIERLALQALLLEESHPTTSTVGAVEGALVAISMLLIVAGFALAFAGHRTTRTPTDARGESVAA